MTITQSGGQPGKDGGTILIRGVGSFNNSSPLVLVDGVEGDIVMINKGMLSRPMIKTDSKFVNLVDNKDLYIDNLI